MGSRSLKKMQPFVRVLATSLEITMSYLIISIIMMMMMTAVLMIMMTTVMTMMITSVDGVSCYVTMPYLIIIMMMNILMMMTFMMMTVMMMMMMMMTSVDPTDGGLKAEACL